MAVHTLLLPNACFFNLSAALCLPSMLKYVVCHNSKRILEKFYDALRFGSLKSKNSHKMECRILENSVENQILLTEKFQDHEQFLLDIFFVPSPPPPT